MTFGARFGLLIRQNREGEGITAGELARRVWEDEAKRSRISDLENGKVKRPQAKTVEALANYFDFTADEIDACRHQPPPQETPTANIDIPSELLENLAQRFGHTNPDAPTPELTTFLKEKAKDYRALQQRLDEITQQDDRLNNLFSTIKSAMDAGNFDEADDRLADAEDIQLNHKTLVEVRKQAAIRTQRAQTALFKGDADKAARFFKEAAAYFTPFDTNEDANALLNAWDALYENGLRYGGTGLMRAIELAEAGVKLHETRSDRKSWSTTKNNLGLALWNQAERMEGQAGAKLLAKAVAAFKGALTVRSKTDHSIHWAGTQNNLAIVFEVQASRMEGKAGAKLLAKAIDAYQAVLSVYTQIDHPVDWAMTQNNLAIALEIQAVRVEGKAGANLLAKAIDAYQAAMTVYTKANYPLQWATTQNNLANALQNTAARVEGKVATELLAKAVATYEAALTVRTKVDHPVDWAMTQENLGGAFQLKSTLAKKTARASLKQALSHFDAALKIYDPAHMLYNYNKVSKARISVTKKLAALD